jgi:hypothetical protein
MAHLRRFLRLSTTELWLLVKATLLLEVIKLGMQLLPFRALRRLLDRVAGTPAGWRHTNYTSVDPSVDKIAWIVEMASRRTPGAKSCLTQALAAQVMLTRRGYPSRLHLGVAKGERGQFKAHAWVESEGKVVMGGSELGGFTPLTVLERERL